jgi:hypothetical protein
VEAALAAAAAEAAALQDSPLAEQGAAVGGLGLQQQLQEEQQQEQAYLAHNVLELQMQQLDELQQLHQAGLLPGYAAAELSGLHLEELDEILVSSSLRGGGIVLRQHWRHSRSWGSAALLSCFRWFAGLLCCCLTCGWCMHSLSTPSAQSHVSIIMPRDVTPTNFDLAHVLLSRCCSWSRP